MLPRPFAALAISRKVELSRSWVAALAMLCTTFSGAASAATLDFSVSDLKDYSLTEGGYVTPLVPGGGVFGFEVGAAQHWGVGVMQSWNESTRDVILPAGTPPPDYWESYTLLFDTSDALLVLHVNARTDSSGVTRLNIERTPNYGSLSIGAEGGSTTIEIGGAAPQVYFDIFVDLDQSWVDFGSGHIYLSEYGEPAIASDWHVPYFMEIEGGYFQSSHFVYDIRLVDNRSASPIPEPETWATLLAGLGLISVMTRRQRKG